MLENRYFIVNIPNPRMSQIYDLAVGVESKQRFSLDGKKVMIKLYLGDTKDYGVLQNATEYTHEEILIVMATPEWYKEDEFI